MREMRSLDTAYTNAVHRYQARMVRVVEGEKAFAERQANTLAYLRRFKSFVTETDQKRIRAEKKEAEERKARQEKETEIASLTQWLTSITGKRDRMKVRLENYKQYGSFLESVLLATDQYTEIDEVLTRHTILQQTDSDLKHQNDEANQRLDALQSLSSSTLKQRQNQVLLATSEYAQLLVRLENLTNSNTMSEASIQMWESSHTQQLAYVAQVNAAIRNIHARITQLQQHTKAQKRKKPVVSKTSKGSVSAVSVTEPVVNSASVTASVISSEPPPVTYNRSVTHSRQTSDESKTVEARRAEAERYHQAHLDGELSLNDAIRVRDSPMSPPPSIEPAESNTATTSNIISTTVVSANQPGSNGRGSVTQNRRSSLDSQKPLQSSTLTAPPATLTRDQLIALLQSISAKLDDLQFVVQNAQDTGMVSSNNSNSEKQLKQASIHSQPVSAQSTTSASTLPSLASTSLPPVANQSSRSTSTTSSNRSLHHRNSLT